MAPMMRQAYRLRPNTQRCSIAASSIRISNTQRPASRAPISSSSFSSSNATAPQASLPRHHSTTASPSSASASTSSASSSPSSSVSPEELAHFNALASSWWDPYGPSRLLHQMNPLRHDFIRECIRDGAPPSNAPSQSIQDLLPRTYLDIGCGGGIFAESAARLPTTTSVTAIDPSAEVLAVARAHARHDPVVLERLQYRPASIEDLAREAASSSSSGADGKAQKEKKEALLYDMVTIFEVIEHVATDPAAFVDQCGRLLRPGGWLVMSTMARTWTSWLTTVVAAEDVLGIVPRGTHDWNKYINADELEAFFAPGAPASRTAVWQNARFQGVAYVPGLGWKVVPGGEKLGNYFFAVQKADVSRQGTQEVCQPGVSCNV
ncbi:Hexaprenyldihydroxybenzoate methyltransferase, mitochondrial [Sporothrix curviconia]|uniref:Ubiquinone biosynthesis O-methyltransferase, mitochondrial n=1 Tax=Sporothrix curviconia TaxID=1260050 RepID=A0ABP0BUH2_9PEZI